LDICNLTGTRFTSIKTRIEKFNKLNDVK